MRLFSRTPDVEALERKGDVRRLAKLTAHTNMGMRERTLDALGTLASVGGNAAAVEALASALGSEHSDVRRGALGWLAELYQWSGPTPMSAVEPLIVMLGDADASVRASAARALGNLKAEPAVEPLIVALGDEDKDVRWRAVTALGEIGDPRAVDALMAALNDSHQDVRWFAASGLGGMPDPKAVEPLIVALRDRDPNVRGSAAQALGAIGDGRAVEPLIAALNDKHQEVWELAASALRELGDPRASESGAVQRFTELIADTTGSVSREIQQRAVWALQNLEKAGPLPAEAVQAISEFEASPEREAQRRAAAWVGPVFTTVSTTADPEEAVRVLFDEALPAAGTSEPKLIEEVYLASQDSGTVYRGDAGQVRSRVLEDLRHMHSEPGFSNFKVQIVGPQNASEVLCFMDERSRSGYAVAVPIRIWFTASEYVVSGVDSSWK